MLSATFRNAALRAYTTSTQNARKVVHVPEKKRFEIEFPNGENAYLNYEKTEGNNFDFSSTVVPAAKKGMGYAEDLASTAFQYAKDAGGTVKATCSWIKDTYLPKNEQWKDIIKK